MYKKKLIAVIVPAFNEERFVKNVVETLPSFVDFVIAIDDGSTDRTFVELLSVASRRVRVLHHRSRRGVGAAIMAGHRAAIGLGSEVDVVMAGDGQMDPAFLAALLEPVASGRFDFSKGNRFLQRVSLKDMPALRIIGNTVLSLLTNLATGYWWIFDSQNGYTAITTASLRQIDLSNISSGYQFETDLLIRLARSKCRVADVSIPSRYSGQQSKIKLFNFIATTSFFLAKAILSRWYHTNPVA